MPLYSVQEAKLHQVASAVPIKINGRSFLVTASHAAFKNGQPVSLYAGLISDDGFQLLCLENFRSGFLRESYDHENVVDADITTIHLDFAEAAALESTYQFSEIQEFSPAEPRNIGRSIFHYLIAGYPSKRNLIVRRAISPTCVHLITPSYRDIEDKRRYKRGIKTSHHFELLVARNLRKDSESKFKLGMPAGMSGGGIWRFESDQNSQTVSHPLLVGILIEARLDRNCKKVITASRLNNLVHLLNASSALT